MTLLPYAAAVLGALIAIPAAGIMIIGLWLMFFDMIRTFRR